MNRCLVRRSVILYLLLAAASLPASAGEGSGKMSGWWFIPRYSVGGLQYSEDNKDTGFNGGTSVLTDILSGELLYRPRTRGRGSWSFWTSANFEFVRQEVLSNSYITPNANLRFFLTYRMTFRGGGSLFIGPAFGGGYGKYTILNITQSDTTAVDSVTRSTLTFGQMVSYLPGGQWGQLTFLGLINRDSGGTSTVLPSALASTMSYEVSGGLSLLVRKHYSFEFRGRLIKRNFEWAPSGGGDSSTFSETYTLFDMGFGFKF